MALQSPSACKGNGFKERPGRSASPVACLFCLFEVVGAQSGSGGTQSGIPSPGWGLSHLERHGQRQGLNLPGVFPTNCQGSEEVHLSLGQGS